MEHPDFFTGSNIDGAEGPLDLGSGSGHQWSWGLATRPWTTPSPCTADPALAESEPELQEGLPLPQGPPPLAQPLRDFFVSMPSLMTQEIDFQGLPHQIKLALAFLRTIRPQDIMRNEVVARLPPLLPPQCEEHKGRQTLVLDLDETLVHCHPSLLVGCQPPALQLRIEVISPPLHAHVYVRPFAQLMLKLVAKVFEVVVFTASAAIYADQVLDFLDPDHRCVAHRLYRQHCTEIAGGHFKDMRRLGRRIEDVMLVDNSPLALGLTPNNGIPVSSWFGEDYNDVELLELLDVLEECCLQASIPAYLAVRYGFSAFLDQQRQRLATSPTGLLGMPTMAFLGPCTGPVTQVPSTVQVMDY